MGGKGTYGNNYDIDYYTNEYIPNEQINSEKPIEGKIGFASEENELNNTKHILDNLSELLKKVENKDIFSDFSASFATAANTINTAITEKMQIPLLAVEEITNNIVNRLNEANIPLEIKISYLEGGTPYYEGDVSGSLGDAAIALNGVGAGLEAVGSAVVTVHPIIGGILIALGLLSTVVGEVFEKNGMQITEDYTANYGNEVEKAIVRKDGIESVRGIWDDGQGRKIYTRQNLVDLLNENPNAFMKAVLTEGGTGEEFFRKNSMLFEDYVELYGTELQKKIIGKGIYGIDDSGNKVKGLDLFLAQYKDEKAFDRMMRNGNYDGDYYSMDDAKTYFKNKGIILDENGRIVEETATVWKESEEVMQQMTNELSGTEYGTYYKGTDKEGKEIIDEINRLIEERDIYAALTLVDQHKVESNNLEKLPTVWTDMGEENKIGGSTKEESSIEAETGGKGIFSSVESELQAAVGNAFQNATNEISGQIQQGIDAGAPYTAEIFANVTLTGEGAEHLQQKGTEGESGNEKGSKGSNTSARMAHGGIINRHSLVEVGEGDNREYIIPITKPKRAMELIGQALGELQGPLNIAYDNMNAFSALSGISPGTASSIRTINLNSSNYINATQPMVAAQQVVNKQSALLSRYQ